MVSRKDDPYRIEFKSLKNSRRGLSNVTLFRHELNSRYSFKHEIQKMSETFKLKSAISGTRTRQSLLSSH